MLVCSWIYMRMYKNLAMHGIPRKYFLKISYWFWSTRFRITRKSLLFIVVCELRTNDCMVVTIIPYKQCWRILDVEDFLEILFRIPQRSWKMSLGYLLWAVISLYMVWLVVEDHKAKDSSLTWTQIVAITDSHMVCKMENTHILLLRGQRGSSLNWTFQTC